MTKPPKTLEEIKQEWINEAFELEKAKAYKCCESCGNNFSNANTYFHYGFKAGFDCRDKLDNEALKIAVEALEIANNELLTVDDHVAYGKMERYYSNEKSYELNKAIHKILLALAEIQKLRGDI